MSMHATHIKCSIPKLVQRVYIYIYIYMNILKKGSARNVKIKFLSFLFDAVYIYKLANTHLVFNTYKEIYYEITIHFI